MKLANVGFPRERDLQQSVVRSQEIVFCERVRAAQGMTKLKVRVDMALDKSRHRVDQLREVTGDLHMSHTATLGLARCSKLCTDTTLILLINQDAQLLAKGPCHKQMRRHNLVAEQSRS